MLDAESVFVALQSPFPPWAEIYVDATELAECMIFIIAIYRRWLAAAKDGRHSSWYFLLVTSRFARRLTIRDWALIFLHQKSENVPLNVLHARPTHCKTTTTTTTTTSKQQQQQKKNIKICGNWRRKEGLDLVYNVSYLQILFPSTFSCWVKMVLIPACLRMRLNAQIFYLIRMGSNQP